MTKWDEIQDYYDDNHTAKETYVNFGISQRQFYKAVKFGYIQVRNKSESTKISKNKYPQRHSEETKKKISEIRKKYLSENPDKVPYKLNHSSTESYPEKY